MGEAQATLFEVERPRLIAIAYRLLGSRADAEDVVQDAWFRFARATEIENAAAWLTTTVTRLALNSLRDRAAHRTHDLAVVDAAISSGAVSEPEQLTILDDAVSAALLVVLDTLNPAERVALVLHDVFAVEFRTIAELLRRSPEATRQLASRARRRIREADKVSGAHAAEQIVMEAFFAATRQGDLAALIRVLHPEVVLTVEGAAAAHLVGTDAVAAHALTFAEPERVVVARDHEPRPTCEIYRRGLRVASIRFNIDDGLITNIRVVPAPTSFTDLLA